MDGWRDGRLSPFDGLLRAPYGANKLCSLNLRCIYGPGLRKILATPWPNQDPKIPRFPGIPGSARFDPWRKCKVRPPRGASLPASRPQLQVSRPCISLRKASAPGIAPSPIQRASTSVRFCRCLGPSQEVPRARRWHRNWVCYCSWSSTNSLHPCKTCSSKYSITTDTENRKENLKPQIASNTLVLSSFKLPNANYRYHCQLLARGLLYNQSISSLQPLHNWPWLADDVARRKCFCQN